MKFATGLAALTVAIASTLAIGQANAIEEGEFFSSNPSARCQPATRVSEAMIRKRPLAMVNEGSSNAVVNCAFEIESDQSLAQAVQVYVSNSTAADVDITCTGISGFETRQANEYLPETLTIQAGTQGLEPFFWADQDFASGTGGLISVACTLPPGTAINDTYVGLLTDDAVDAPAPAPTP